VATLRHLYLLRHAKSSWDQPGLPDHERPLADRGRDSVLRIARYVEDRGIDPQLILCSSARRTRDTLAGVLPARAADALIEPELFHIGHDQLLQRLRRIEPEVASVMVVGHNPTLQVLTLILAGAEAQARPSGVEGLTEIRRKLPTGALVTLSFVAPWSALAPGVARLEDYIRPKALLPVKRS
jgi:phosphohistidine phosphatase